MSGNWTEAGAYVCIAEGSAGDIIWHGMTGGEKNHG